MLEDIKKILASVKKGVVIMEDGKPAYVLVPFQEYQETVERKKLAGENIYQERFSLRQEMKSQPIDDASFIQKMIDYEMNVGTAQLSQVQEMEIQSLISRFDGAKEQEKNAQNGDRGNSLNLGDLPF